MNECRNECLIESSKCLKLTVVLGGSGREGRQRSRNWSRKLHHSRHFRAMESSMQTMQKRRQASEFPQGTHTREPVKGRAVTGVGRGYVPGYVADDTDFNNERHIVLDVVVVRGRLCMKATSKEDSLPVWHLTRARGTHLSCSTVCLCCCLPCCIN